MAPGKRLPCNGKGQIQERTGCALPWRTRRRFAALAPTRSSMIAATPCRRTPRPGARPATTAAEPVPMPRFTPDALRQIGCELFSAAGCRPEHARAVSEHLVESNLFGHDSHGAIRFYEYAEGLRTGLYQAQTVPEVVRQTPATAVVDGHGALGPIGATFATRLAIDKAQVQGMATVTLRNTCHIARVGAYPLIAAREGLIAQIFVNAGHHGVWVAPFGGIDGKLSTNPLAFAAPRRDADPILLDMTTSMAAMGKVFVAANRGDQLPEGWIIDAEGRPSTDPEDMMGKPHGALLPLGGSMGYKGYGLGLMIEILGGALSGQGCAAGEYDVVSNGVLITVYRIDVFAEIDQYYEDVESLVRHIRSSRLAPGTSEILMPGAMEFANARQREHSGIDLDPTTWEKICLEAQRFDLDIDPWNAMAIN